MDIRIPFAMILPLLPMEMSKLYRDALDVVLQNESHEQRSLTHKITLVTLAIFKTLTLLALPTAIALTIAHYTFIPLASYAIAAAITFGTSYLISSIAFYILMFEIAKLDQKAKAS